MEYIKDRPAARPSPFFGDQFDLIRRTLFPRVRAADEPLVAWVAGCGIGESAYGLAALLEVEFATNYRILATDEDEGLLEIARNGVYPARRLAEIPPDHRGPFRLGSGEVQDWFTATDALKRRVVFRAHALNDSALPRQAMFHLILCPGAVDDATLAKLRAGAKPGALILAGDRVLEQP